MFGAYRGSCTALEPKDAMMKKTLIAPQGTRGEGNNGQVPLILLTTENVQGFQRYR